MSKIGRAVVGFAMLFLFGSPTVFAQVGKDSISIGDIVLTPGTRQVAVLEKLGEDFDIKRTDKGDNPSKSRWSIRTKDGQQNIVGSVSFKNGKLRIASKTWADLYADKGATELARAVLGVIAEFEKERTTACTVATDRSMNPRGELNVATVTCGKRELAVSIFRGEHSDDASVEETIYAH